MNNTLKRYLYLLPIVLTLMACGQEKASKPTPQPQKVKKEHVPHRMIEYYYEDSLQMGSHQLVYSLHRMAVDSLPMVVDENGDRFVDNHYDLTVSRDGQPFFQHRFTKASFLALLDKGFREGGILDGFRFVEKADGKLIFSACVSYPESDMFTPILVTIGPDGSYTVEPDTSSDEELLDSIQDDGV